MTYTVLARKYRSQTFDDVVGQAAISQTLRNAIKTGRVAHAFLFVGTRGVGKTTMARILAKSLNCLSFDSPTIKPCCKCESCAAVGAGEDIDVIEIDGASNNGVEEVRRLRENAIYRPAPARYKIYIIDEVHMLSTNAFNALLKILEEPPSHVKFIFATTEPNKILATIQSRCQRFDFNNIGAKDIAGHLKYILGQEKIEYEEELVVQLSRMANGSMRDGLSLLDRLISIGEFPLTGKLLEEYLGCPDSEKIFELISKIGDSDAGGTLSCVDSLIGGGLSEVQIVDSLVDVMRDLMVAKSMGAETELLILTTEQRKRAGELAVKFDIAGLVYNITTLEKLRWGIRNSDTGRALLEASLLRFALSEHFMNVDSLLGGMESGSVKKKPVTVKAADESEVRGTEAENIEEKVHKLTGGSLEDVKSGWQEIAAAVSIKLGKGTAAALSSGEPKSFENDELRIGFGAESAMSKKLCESNGKAEGIEGVISEVLGRKIKVKFEKVSEGAGETGDDSKKTKSNSEKRKEIEADPAVRMILAELDATVMGVEEEDE